MEVSEKVATVHRSVEIKNIFFLLSSSKENIRKRITSTPQPTRRFADTSNPASLLCQICHVAVSTTIKNGSMKWLRMIPPTSHSSVDGISPTTISSNKISTHQTIHRMNAMNLTIVQRPRTVRETKRKRRSFGDSSQQYSRSFSPPGIKRAAYSAVKRITEAFVIHG